MLLCDVGNTSYHFYDGMKAWRCSSDFDPYSVADRVAYINVNARVQQQIENCSNWFDLALHVRWEKYYETMGIDRIMACEALENGIIIDAGSAITVDVMRKGVHEGGFIYPGVRAMQETYKRLSSRLDYAFNFDLDFGKMPKNSQDAISYGFLGTLKASLWNQDLPLVLTGGDAVRLAPVFPEARIEPLLLFKGMQKIIDKGNIC